MLEASLFAAFMLLVAYLVTARRSGVWKGRQIIWPTLRAALSGTAIILAIILWKLWWGDSAAGSVFFLMFAAVLILFFFFFVKAIVKRTRS